MSYPNPLVVLPLEDKVLLPGVVVRLVLRGPEATDLCKSFFRKSETGSVHVLCVPLAAKTPLLQLEDEEEQVQGQQQKDQEGENMMENDNCGSQAPSVPLPASPSKDPLVTPDQRARFARMGCIAKMTRVQRSGVGTFGVYLEGVQRARLGHQVHASPVSFHVDPVPEGVCPGHLVDGYKSQCKNFVDQMSKLNMPDPLIQQLVKLTHTLPPLALADLLTSIIDTTVQEKWLMLHTTDPGKRLELMMSWIHRQLHVLRISQQVHTNMEAKLSQQQREFYLKQQLEAIRSELGNDTNSKEDDDMTELHKLLAEAHLPEHVISVAQRELKRLKRMQPSSTEWSVSRNYLQWLAEMPWDKADVDLLDIQQAKEQLDHDHFGLDRIKKRILEHLSVIKMKGDLRAPILCFAGPPGVGKTSLGKSIAKALGRSFHRVSLGGVRDEADIRGHRRTYVGSQPGLIVQGIHKVGVNNPVLLLDEIDKLVQSTHYGDPSAALLEVLDPEQNGTFNDHYLNVSFDLSKVMFIATANDMSTIPGPLLDRMEVIDLAGYTLEEKLHIAKTYLMPKQLAAHGVPATDVLLEDDVLQQLIQRYTRESGVRNLERAIASVIRAKCVTLVQNKQNQDTTVPYNPRVTIDDLASILGIARFDKEVAERDATPGVVTGLAYQGSGNGGIMFVEATKMPGKGGELVLTGSLGDVIKESAMIALTWVKAHAFELNLTASKRTNIVEHDDIHIHFPSGSIPKDGPSAGVTMVCALVSLFADLPVATTTAMTGEISLRGQVLPVGGIKEKVISAHSAGIRRVLLPYRNRQDVDADVPASIKMDMDFVYCKTIWEVLHTCFTLTKLPRVYESHL
ncbi:Lon protease C-terminal proteolytic domain-containing protein [Gongronella butleri]|nr:Lon protease C-terminal proteolytic domain-containing protein [Gongronella butleri]